jgi:hypothetical protein
MDPAEHADPVSIDWSQKETGDSHIEVVHASDQESRGWSPVQGDKRPVSTSLSAGVTKMPTIRMHHRHMSADMVQGASGSSRHTRTNSEQSRHSRTVSSEQNISISAELIHSVSADYSASDA